MAVSLDEPKRRTARRDVLKSAVAIAEHYGFRDFRDLPRPSKLERGPVSTPDLASLRGSREYAAMQESFIPQVLKNGLLRKNSGDPLLIYGIKRHKGARQKPACTFALELIGMPGSFSEALLVRTAVAILEDAGERHLSVDINSLGDHETYARYVRDCAGYYRKYLQSLHGPCRDALGDNPLVPLGCSHESCGQLRDEAPKPIAYLNESGRRHFKEVLEYLEILDIPYRIRETLVPAYRPYTKTIFEIRPISETLEVPVPDRVAVPPLAHGGRYDDFARKLGSRTDIAAAGILLTLAAPLPEARLLHTPIKPRAYFIQIGPEAKRRSLIVLEILRRAHVSVYQSVGMDKMSGQLLLAESLGLPYTIIMGHKEAVEDTVIVRRTDTRSQETVPIADLSRYAKLIK